MVLGMVWTVGGGTVNKNRIKQLGKRKPAKIPKVGDLDRPFKDPNSNKATETQVCKADTDCGAQEYCSTSQKKITVCLSCRRKTKRCSRNSMCCPGNCCYNGVCVPDTQDESSKKRVAGPLEVAEVNLKPETEAESESLSNPQANPPKMKGHEGDTCYRSSDCAQGFCCSRYLWSKICKPLLQEGEVCTRQKRKGMHRLQIYERCDCAGGLTCRVSKRVPVHEKPRLNTCQKH
nr:PREDICTED: dickkopf-related protein 2-like [Latimeria chalumnae]|eukprot:XP_005989421.2 PREDICTED: dickkopf-related protein 2-like [Latimeria chalumnae]